MLVVLPLGSLSSVRLRTVVLRNTAWQSVGAPISPLVFSLVSARGRMCGGFLYCVLWSISLRRATAGGVARTINGMPATVSTLTYSYYTRLLNAGGKCEKEKVMWPHDVCHDAGER